MGHGPFRDLGYTVGMGHGSLHDLGTWEWDTDDYNTWDMGPKSSGTWNVTVSDCFSKILVKSVCPFLAKIRLWDT